MRSQFRTRVRSTSVIIPLMYLLSACGDGSPENSQVGSSGSSASAPETGSPSNPAPTPAPESAPAPSPAPAPAPTAPLAPPTLASTAAPAATGPIYYFSDCQAGAHRGCVPGNNANAGTSPQAPRQNLAAMDWNTLPAGTRLLFARGGAWSNFGGQLVNQNVSAANPLVIDAYTPPWGGAARPRLTRASGQMFEFGRFNFTAAHCGYHIRNVTIDGLGSAAWAIWTRDNVHDVHLHGVEVTGWSLGLHTTGNTNQFSLRDSHIHHNSAMGWLGSVRDFTVDGNYFNNNNFSGSVFEHAIYFGSGSHLSGNGTVSANAFVDNSVNTANPAAGCQGGNVTMHGLWDNVRFVYNRIEVPAGSSLGCWGFSITAAYSSAESFTRIVIADNALVGPLGSAVAASSAPGISVARNVFFGSQYGVSIPGIAPGAGDATDNGADIRDNSFIDVLRQPVSLQPQAGTVTQSGNLVTSSGQLAVPPSAGNHWSCTVASTAALAGACAR